MTPTQTHGRCRTDRSALGALLQTSRGSQSRLMHSLCYPTLQVDEQSREPIYMGSTSASCCSAHTSLVASQLVSTLFQHMSSSIGVAHRPLRGHWLLRMKRDHEASTPACRTYADGNQGLLGQQPKSEFLVSLPQQPR